MQFRDRADAGQQLADRLGDMPADDPIVLALPRGGVPVSLEIARRWGAPLEVIGVRKLGAPGRPEFGIGAVAEGGVRVVDQASVAMLALTPEDVDELALREQVELRRRVARYRGDREVTDVAGRTVVVVDDGLATGVTARAALRSVRARNASRTILAVPVGAAETVEALRADADDVVTVLQPERFMAVGAWYQEFRQTTDEEVVAALEEARAARSQS